MEMVLAVCGLIMFCLGAAMILARSGGTSVLGLCLAVLGLSCVYLADPMHYRKKPLPSAVGITGVPTTKLVKQFECAGSVVFAPAAAQNQGTVVLVVKLDPIQGSELRFVPAIAPATPREGSWFSGQRVKVACYTIYLSDNHLETDYHLVTQSAWFIQ